MLRALLKRAAHVFALDHDPALSAQWVCPCWMCKAANPDQLTPADYVAKSTKGGMCGLWCAPKQYCMRANGHAGRCLP
jgi:hypothetical protein